MLTPICSSVPLAGAVSLHVFVRQAKADEIKHLALARGQVVETLPLRHRKPILARGTASCTSRKLG